MILLLITQPDSYVEVCSVEYLTIEIELVLPTFKSLDHLHN